MKKALLVVAHGSRRETSNDEVRAITTKVRESSQVFDLVECGFLELAEPSIVQAGNQLINRGATDIVVLPYFLAAGRHVTRDIPDEVALIDNQHPSTRIIIAPNIGAAAGMQQLVLEHLQQINSSG